ncbi:hypothetical protein TRFO_29295 [Tritrichomonas foetus]|uniref:E2F/DP family winged-helix DNA-binding domain-containing protein n=1 Tax=Tritrichomonas foetus TaxID=1144522 RepID=A0A1J4JW11_9EUKA|nr:hypothetical protein TRFO_29295 [Tritrichomonas foetus]|eukprot:OHT03319.1 hypothetical protein TRFO_29295 [Tritrichomonas foetus]
MNAQKLNIKVLTANIIGIMRNIQETTNADIINILSNEIYGINVTENNKKDIKRRVYDIICVLEISGIIRKNGKYIKFNGLPESSTFNTCDNGDMSLKRIRAKEKMLKEKEYLLALYKSIIQRNMRFDDDLEDSEKIHLPAVIVGTGKYENVETKMDEAKCDIEISSSEYISITPPEEIAKRLDIPMENIQKYLNSYFKLDSDNITISDEEFKGK